MFQGLSSVPNVHLWSVWFVIFCGQFVGCFFLLREYILKVHVLVSSEHKLYDIWNTCIMPCIYWSITYWNKLLIKNLIKFTIKSFTMYINNIYIIMWSCLIHNMRISMTCVLTVLFHCVLHTCMRCMVKLEMCRETNQ